MKSVLSCGNEDVKALVQHVVHQRSIAESLGNSVFTMAALSFFDDLDKGKHALDSVECPKKDSFPIEFLDQTTMAACLRAVRLEDPVSPRPPPITFRKEKHANVVQKYLREAQEKLVSLNTTNVPWPYLPSFKDTFNQSARSYMTILVNNLWMHATKRLRTVINAEIGPYLEADKKLKSCRSYIHNKIFREIVGATMKTNIDAYKNKDDIELCGDQFFNSVAIKDMIKEHRAWLYNAFEDSKTWLHYTDGVLSESNVQNRPHLYLAYQLFLAQRLDTIRAGSQEEGDQYRQKATFQIIPQLTMKRRCVTFGKAPTADLLYFLAKRDQVGDFIKE